MVNLTRASEELFCRRPDERFATLDDLYRYCSESKAESTDRWCPPTDVAVQPARGGLLLSATGESLGMNDWSFSQACSLAKVSKDTINKLSPETAARVFAETWPGGSKPLQVFSTGADGAFDSRSQLHSAAQRRTALAGEGICDGLRPCTAGDGYRRQPGRNNAGDWVVLR
jgi:hypothetical protein